VHARRRFDGFFAIPPRLPHASSVSDRIARDLFAIIDAARAGMYELLGRLVAVPTENPPGVGYEQCVDLLEAAASSLGLRPQRIAIVVGGQHRRWRP
jgi:hypothetical protein